MKLPKGIYFNEMSAIPKLSADWEETSWNYIRGALHLIFQKNHFNLSIEELCLVHLTLRTRKYLIYVIWIIQRNCMNILEYFKGTNLRLRSVY